MRRRREGRRDVFRWTEQRVLTPETAADVREIVGLLPRPLPPLPEALADLQEAVDSDLARLGWPPFDAIVHVEANGAWEVVRTLEERNGGTRGYAFIEKTAEPHSQAWFLAKIGWELTRISGSRGRPEAEATLFDAGIQIGAYIQELKLRRKTFRYAEAGKRSIEVGPESKAVRWPEGSFAEKHGPEAQAYAEDLYREDPKRTWGYIQGEVAKKYGVSPGTVKTALRNPKKVG